MEAVNAYIPPQETAQTPHMAASGNIFEASTVMPQIVQLRADSDRQRHRLSYARGEYNRCRDLLRFVVMNCQRSPNNITMDELMYLRRHIPSSFRYWYATDATGQDRIMDFLKAEHGNIARNYALWDAIAQINRAEDRFKNLQVISNVGGPDRDIICYNPRFDVILYDAAEYGDVLEAEYLQREGDAFNARYMVICLPDVPGMADDFPQGLTIGRQRSIW